ncbi:uncharacterized protein LOC127866003 [Dreissena polymorpha]|uniref:Uncharacterized protein n=1 Tax=Dreissena polymorpha TaxID=45954 RepID=A0A9D4LPA1_DREPO|nr:uncharacterized protein LOC127866003 [Dreissena polymorpha]KAH3861576.1 hypothetical protein DPMN_024508 [Dreissena polymorpha]
MFDAMVTEKLDLMFGQGIQEGMQVNGKKYTPQRVFDCTEETDHVLTSSEKIKYARLCETPSRSVRRFKQNCSRILNPLSRKTKGLMQTPVCPSADSLDEPLRTSAGNAPSPMHASFWSMDTPATQPRGLIDGRMRPPLTLCASDGQFLRTPSTPRRLSMSRVDTPLRLSMSTIDTPLRRSFWSMNTPRRLCTGSFGNGHATPKRQLVRVTENAIETFVKDNIESNIPVIRHLENLSYKLWVESNTAFLLEAAMTDDADDDGWIWDEDCFFSSSLESNAVKSLQDADSGSSIGSSIRVCDDSDCSFGYLASCESLDTCTDQFPQCRKLCDTNHKISIPKRNNFCHKSPEIRTSTNFESKKDRTRRNAVLDHVNTFSYQRDISVTENAPTDDVLLDDILFSYNCYQENVPRSNGSPMGIATNNEDEWVIVDDDCVPEVSGAGTHTSCRGRSSPVDIKRGQGIAKWNGDSTKCKKFHGNKDCNDDSMEITESVDLSEWAILSLNITERTQYYRAPRTERSSTGCATDNQRTLIFKTVREAIRQLGMEAGNNASNNSYFVTSGGDTRARIDRPETDGNAFLQCGPDNVVIICMMLPKLK